MASANGAMKKAAFIKCRKCGTIARVDGKTCPTCHPSRTVIKRRPVAARLGAGALAVVIAAGIAAWVVAGGEDASTPEIAQRASDDAPAAADSADNHRAAMTAAIARSVKNALPDPGALEWRRISANDSASVVCLEYRLRNAAGEAVDARFSYVEGRTSERMEDWSRHCAGKRLKDMAHLKEKI